MAKNEIFGSGVSLPAIRAEKTALLQRIKVLDDVITALENYEASGW